MKYIFIIFALLNTLQAYEKKDIISDLLISINKKQYMDINSVEIDNNIKKFDLKIILNKNKIKDDIYYLRINHMYQNIKDINVKAKRSDNNLLIKLTKDTKKEIILNIDILDKKSSVFLDFDLFDEKEVEKILSYEKLLYGFAYGIIFTAFLYNFVLFLYNRKKSFLYYSLLQFSLLGVLVTSVMTFDFIKPLYEYIPVNLFFGQVAFIFAILFNRAFLDTKNYIPKIDKILQILLIITIIDSLFIISGSDAFIDDYLPTSLFLAILVLSSFIVYKQGYKVALFYILGWSSIFISIFLVEFDLVDYSTFYALHFGIPIESLILSFSLAYKIKELEKKKLVHEQMLIHQNKLASMGEMIHNIAHQYRQPLTHLGYILMNINSSFEHGELDSKYLSKKMKQANKQLEFMSHTIDDFRDFFKPKKEKEYFLINKAISNAINIIKPILTENEITIVLNIDKSKKLLGFENEYSQVILNLLSNAKDSLITNNIKYAKIEIILLKNKLLIKDNSMGVDKHLEEKIFEPYFTTKSNSSGIGLYMSSMIIQEHFKGKLYLENSIKGATFIIETN